jgi:hypothetical protein
MLRILTVGLVLWVPLPTLFVQNAAKPSANAILQLSDGTVLTLSEFVFLGEPPWSSHSVGFVEKVDMPVLTTNHLYRLVPFSEVNECVFRSSENPEYRAVSITLHSGVSFEGYFPPTPLLTWLGGHRFVFRGQYKTPRVLREFSLDASQVARIRHTGPDTFEIVDRDQEKYLAGGVDFYHDRHPGRPQIKKLEAIDIRIENTSVSLEVTELKRVDLIKAPAVGTSMRFRLRDGQAGQGLILQNLHTFGRTESGLICWVALRRSSVGSVEFE